MEIEIDGGFRPLVVIYNPSPPDTIARDQKSQEFLDRPVSAIVEFSIGDTMLSEDA